MLATKPTEMNKIREEPRLRLDRKASVREIALACNIGRRTVDEYLHRATARISLLASTLVEVLAQIEVAKGCLLVFTANGSGPHDWIL